MENHIIKDEKVKNEIVELVLRQTGFSREEAILNLELNNYNFHKVILEYMKPPKAVENDDNKKKININQQIFKEIRNLMDEGERRKRFNEELKKRIS